MSELESAWNEKKLPKNIRQVGETEGQSRIYLEDYVYTYVRKSIEKREAQVVCGFLVGTWETIEQGRYYFAKGAMVAEGLLSARESKVIGTPLWKKNRELAEYYFPGQQLIGWFLRCREEGFYEESELRKMHENLFPEGDAMLYLQQDEEQQMYFGSSGQFEQISGYYIYFEKNEDMQNYMLEKGSSAPEEHLTQDTAIAQYRVIMKEKQEQKGRRQEAALRRICVGLGAAVLFLASYTWYGQYRLREQERAVPAEAESAYVEAGALVENGGEPLLRETQEVVLTEEAKVLTVAEGTEACSELLEIPETSAIGETQLPVQETENVPAEEAAAPGLHYYEVRNGDTLAGICLSLYGTIDVLPSICELNQIENPAMIYNGQRIYLP